MANMRCSNVQLDNKRLLLSALETKNGDPFSMPLSDAAVTLFQSCVAGKTSTDLVFPLAGEKPMTSWKSLLNSVRNASDIPDFGWHHIRRTFMTTLSEQGIGSADVADALLNHRQSASRSGVRAAYDHSALWPRKVEMMRAWSDLVGNAINKGRWTISDDQTVVPLRQT
jgi:integrase